MQQLILGIGNAIKWMMEPYWAQETKKLRESALHKVLDGSTFPN
jgi:hypothetical protein